MFYTICLPSPPLHGPLHTYLSLDKASLIVPVTDGRSLLTPKHHKNKTGPSHRFPNNSQQTDGGCISATHLLVTGPLTWSQMDKSGAERREVIYYNREISNLDSE